MSDAGGLGGFSLFELFKFEAESHCAALSSGLLSLEQNPADASLIASLMRAAHSVKGAARILGLSDIVSLAHAMEEVFLAAKEGREKLAPGRIDQLLRCTDLLGGVRECQEATFPEWVGAHAPEMASLTAALRAQPEASPAPAEQRQAAPAQPEKPEPAPPVPVAPPVPAPASVTESPDHVRVASGIMSRLVSLSGQSAVESTRFQHVRDELARLRVRERAVEASLVAIREEAARKPGTLAARELEQSHAAFAELQQAMVTHAATLEETLRRLEELSGETHATVLRSRMRPFAEGTAAFPRMVRDISRQLGKSVTLRIEGERVEVDREILQKLESPLTHMLRNSLDHGIELPADRVAAGKPESGQITLAARHQSGMLVIEVRDDGRGIDPETIRVRVVERKLVDLPTAQRLSREELMEFPFLPGFSTKEAATELSGRGVGLDIVRTMVQQVSGVVALDSEPGKGTRFTLRLPVTRSIVRAAIVRVGTHAFAAPLSRLHAVALVDTAALSERESKRTLAIDGEEIDLVPAAGLLGLQGAAIASAPILVVNTTSGKRSGLVVDAIEGEEDIVVRPLDRRLGAVPHISAAAIRGDGLPVLVLDLDDLARSMEIAIQDQTPLALTTHAEAPRTRTSIKRILVVDDSITVREVERQLLKRAGYEVDVAVDGKEGLNALLSRQYDLLVSDVDMPRMTGIELTKAVRSDARLAAIPIIIVSYKDREEDRRAGLEAGANIYLTKAAFHDESLVRMVHDLIGAPA